MSAFCEDSLLCLVGFIKDVIRWLSRRAGEGVRTMGEGGGVRETKSKYELYSEKNVD